ncbi:MAG TPA: hypothetical protein VMJ72_03150 [Candidatus Paceibacterota bacterium]|nr:hypothetical protein [Candidatus Paceibacterota bacterium]
MFGSVLVVCGAGVWGGHLVLSRLPRAAEATPTPRQPLGIWCRADECQFWDASGTRWGSVVRSVGPLLLLVDDLRTTDEAQAGLVAGILAAVDGLPSMGLRAVSVTLPDAEPGGIHITTSAGYDLYMDALGDVPDQLSTLAVFVADRAKDPTFKPQYLDLRTPGHVYFK